MCKSSSIQYFQPQDGILNFNVDVPGPMGIEGALRNERREILWRVKESNEAKVLPAKEALVTFKINFKGSQIIERDP